LKPYWGKPAVRNFREGGGNVLMIWWPFAPKPERADTLEVTDLHSDAPPLYSTVKRKASVEQKELHDFDGCNTDQKG